MKLSEFIVFLNKLEEKRIFYKIVPGQRWEIEFWEDNTVDIEKFISDIDLYDVSELKTLFKEYGGR